MENSMEASEKLKIELSYGLPVLFWDIQKKNQKRGVDIENRLVNAGGEGCGMDW